jgi:diadenosine tetraphosphate (Ap4A) HIT family hydrolase
MPEGDELERGTSPFLELPQSAWVASNELAFAIPDRFPVSKGHALVITRRLVATWFDASIDERQAILALVDEVKRRLDNEHQPDGYNVGFNAGLAAGQTVMHLHVHVIPRYRSDMDDPRGGVRHVLPSKGNYLCDVRSLATGGAEDPFARHVLPLFATADEIAIVAAFVQDSGLSRIETDLHAAVRRGARVRIVTGDYLDITQASALERLVDWQESARASGTEIEADVPAGHSGSVETRVIEVEKLPGFTRAFHPKSWRFESSRYGVAFVGSRGADAHLLLQHRACRVRTNVAEHAWCPYGGGLLGCRPRRHHPLQGCLSAHLLRAQRSAPGFHSSEQFPLRP